MSAPARPSRLRLAYAGGDEAVVELFWNDAPRTCAAVCEQLARAEESTGKPMEVQACHGRHSGAEALFLTPDVIPLGEENAVEVEIQLRAARSVSLARSKLAGVSHI